MPQTSEYTKHGLGRETWVALCTLILTGPIAKQHLPELAAYEELVASQYAVVIDGLSQSLAATPQGAMLFCRCLNVNTVQEGIEHLQALSVLHQASHSH